MTLTFNQGTSKKVNPKAISLCLYKSDKFDKEKHLTPIREFIKGGCQAGYDVLIFHEPGMAGLIPKSKYVRMFEVTSTEAGFQRHFWRYLGAALDYEWLWFRGTDTPRIPPREVLLQETASAWKLDAVIWQSVKYTCTARMAVAGPKAKGLLEFLRAREGTNEMETEWHCDEQVLSSWIDLGLQKVLVAMDSSISGSQLQAEWVSERLRAGHHTVIIKDRDDRLFTPSSGNRS